MSDEKKPRKLPETMVPVAPPLNPHHEWRIKQQLLQTYAKQGGVDLLFVGGSTAAAMNNAPDVSALMQMHWSVFKPAAFGSDGDCTQHLLWRIARGQFDGLTPKVIVVLIGTSNIGTNHPREISRGQLAVIEALQSKMPQATVLNLAILPRGQHLDDPMRQGALNVNWRTRLHLSVSKRIFYLDAYDSLVEEDGEISPAIMPDFLHLSKEGYARLFSRIAPAVNRLLLQAENGKCNNPKKGGMLRWLGRAIFALFGYGWLWR